MVRDKHIVSIKVK